MRWLRTLPQVGSAPLNRSNTIQQRLASSVNLPPKSKRQEKIDFTNMMSHSKLYNIDRTFGIFDKSIRKVVDLGFAPGNWSEYAKYRMSELHGLDDKSFSNNCHVLGFDILFTKPPRGISSIQGNIFSRFSHENIVNHFKDVALKEYQKARTEEQMSIESEIEELALNLAKLSLEDLPSEVVTQTLAKREEILSTLDYRPDLILSDMCAPFSQIDGFFNSTQSRPYQRLASVSPLNKTFDDPHSSVIDMADAALLLTCKLLKPDGSLVLRLGKVLVQDHEIDLLEQKLRMVFDNVEVLAAKDDQGKEHEMPQKDGKQITKTNVADSIFGEVMCICKNKKNDGEFKIQDIF